MGGKKRDIPDDERRLRAALGQTIRDLRKPSYSQDDFADKVGIYRSHMGSIEQGKIDLRLSTLIRVATALHLAPDALLARARLALEHAPESDEPRR